MGEFGADLLIMVTCAAGLLDVVQGMNRDGDTESCIDVMVLGRVWHKLCRGGGREAGRPEICNDMAQIN